MARFRSDNPGIALRLHDVVSDRYLDLVARGEVDFGINAQHGNTLEFEAHLLFNERLYLICQAADPLALRKDIKLKDLRHHAFIHTVRTGSVWQQMLPMLNAAGVRDSGLEVTQFATLAVLVSVWCRSSPLSFADAKALRRYPSATARRSDPFA
jgi:LysR family transcriptional regulator, carnitine catabolism transcriptional activator